MQLKVGSQPQRPSLVPPVFRPQPQGLAQLKVAAMRTLAGHRTSSTRIAAPRPPNRIRSRTIQRTPEESEGIAKLGHMWNRIAELDPKSNEKLQFFVHVKEIQEKLGFKVYTVWHKHDPYVGGGKNKNYVKIIQALQGQDQGKTSAETYVDWATGQTRIDQVPHELQELIIIVHIAEIGRGFTRAPKDLLEFMKEVKDASSKEERVNLWHSFKERLQFALTAKEDTEFVPNDDSNDY